MKFFPPPGLPSNPEKAYPKDWKGWDEFIGHSPNPKPYNKMTDDELKAELLRLAEEGGPKPEPNSVLGRALKRFTTTPEPQRSKDFAGLAERVFAKYDAWCSEHPWRKSQEKKYLKLIAGWMVECGHGDCPTSKEESEVFFRQHFNPLVDRRVANQQKGAR